jgi:hypothetical protein
MQNLTKNMLNEMKSVGKEMPQDEKEDGNLVRSKSDNSILKIDKSQNNSIVRSHEISITKRKDEIVRESEIQIIVDKAKSFEKLEKSEVNNISYDKKIKEDDKPNKIEEEYKPIQQPFRKKKEGGCKCLIF